MTDSKHIYVALPVMDEPDWLPTLLSTIEKQNYPHFTVVVCVNQPDDWWREPSRIDCCERNDESLTLLNNYSGFNMVVIDRSSPGSGWSGKRHGVGWARKTVMDYISDHAEPTDIILSLDADTLFSENYFAAVAETLSTHPTAGALALPYYHHLPEDQDAARSILHYEIYMRYYLLNLLRIGSPYAFTALGSAMALPVWAYRKVGGMTPKLSGEDFYFLQKLRKAGSLICWNSEKVFPAARFSSRVFFGTGPAMIRGAGGDWSSYPIYPYELFNEIAESYTLFPEMYRQTIETPVVGFLRDLTGAEDPFATIRKNASEVKQFVRACHEKFDGLRILQYLKKRHQEEGGTDEERLGEWMDVFYPKDTGYRMPDKKKFSFLHSSLEEINRVRDLLSQEEDRIRKQHPLL
ncbi:glycosyltransferase [Bacteroidota bacterium]